MICNENEMRGWMNECSVRWCAMVCDGVQWCAMVCNGVQWCAMVCNGVQW